MSIPLAFCPLAPSPFRGDQRDPNIPPVAQSIDEPSFLLAAEREPVHLPDRRQVGGRSGPDGVAHETRSDGRSASLTCMRISPSRFRPLPSPPSPQ